MSTTRILAWNTGYQVIGKVISTIIGVAVVALMTRYLGQEGFGIYSTANAYFQIFALLLDLGLNVMIVQMLGENTGTPHKEDRIIRGIFTLRLLSAFVILGIAPIIGLFLNYPWELKLTIFALWASFFSTALNQIVVGVQQRHFKMYAVALAEVGGRLLLLLGLLLAIRLDWGLIPVVGIVSLGGVVNFLINLLIAQQYASFAWSWDPAFWRELLSRSWPIGVSILFNIVYFKADTLVLSYVRPFTEVGIYSAAYRVLEILVTLPFMYCGVLLPLLAHHWATRQTGAFQHLLRQSYLAMLMFAAPLVAGTWVLGPRIMRLVAGESFEASGDVLRILVFAVAIIFVGTVSSHAIVALNMQRRALPLYIATAAITLLGYLLFIPTYGMWAAAGLTVFSEICVALGTSYFALRTSSTSLPWISFFKILASAFLMGAILLLLQDTSLWISIPAGTLIYALLLLATGTLSKSTLRELFALRQQPATPPPSV